METEIVLNAMKKKGYTVYSDGTRPLNLNLIGIRTMPVRSEFFDDLLVVLIPQSNGEWTKFEYVITTDPGYYWLQNPSNVYGTAILCEGQYKKAFRIGLHHNKYTALVQASTLKVYRDGDKDNIVDMSLFKTQWGMFGINMHRSNPYHPTVKVDKWSGGCQVFQSPSDYAKFIKMCCLSADIYGRFFTYTLLNTDDL